MNPLLLNEQTMSSVTIAEKPTIVVAGITRSGLSLTMQMLDAGGFPVCGQFPAYEEHSMGCIPWPEVSGQAVKLVDAHRQLPPRGNFRVIRLVRDLKQQAASFNQWMKITTTLGPFPKRTLIKSFKIDYRTIDHWAARYPLLRVHFEELITAPNRSSRRIAKFVGAELDVDAMARCVVLRSSDCHDGLLELRMVEALAREGAL